MGAEYTLFVADFDIPTIESIVENKLSQRFTDGKLIQPGMSARLNQSNQTPSRSWASLIGFQSNVQLNAETFYNSDYLAGEKVAYELFWAIIGSSDLCCLIYNGDVLLVRKSAGQLLLSKDHEWWSAEHSYRLLALIEPFEFGELRLAG